MKSKSASAAAEEPRQFSLTAFAPNAPAGLSRLRDGVRDLTTSLLKRVVKHKAPARFRSTRPQVYAVNGMAATSHPIATLAAVNMLQAGGNAMDAAIAASAVQAVVEPGSTGIGGDCFALYMPNGREPVAFNGSGRLPEAATLEAYRAAVGTKEIPRRSPFAVTIPGAVDAWCRLLADHGTKTLREVLQPAIDLAFNGYAIAERVNLDWSDQERHLSHEPQARRTLLPDGIAPPVGSIHRQPELGRTLEAIAATGRDAFYGGEVARDMVDSLRSRGGVHTLADFEAAGGEYVTPIHTTFRGRDIVECPPNGQGIVALLILNILSGFRPASGGAASLERYHREIEATRLAYAVRNAAVGDPAFAAVPMDEMLSEQFARRLTDMIRPGKRIDHLPAYVPPLHRDTVTISVVDKDRNAASFINSTFHVFGSGIMTDRTGIVFHDRATSFSLEPGHPNAVAPGKRPLHTIIPGLAVADGRPVLSFGITGGHYQAMAHASLLSSVYDYGTSLQEAMDLPRVFPVPGSDEVNAEPSLDPEVADGLKSMGYRLTRPKRPIGGAQAVAIDWEHGTLVGASDMRKDGCALGY
ncbi:MAG: gamma-glutamyltransferase family protein [Hyphomicrobiales bacterium]